MEAPSPAAGELGLRPTGHRGSAGQDRLGNSPAPRLWLLSAPSVAAHCREERRDGTVPRERVRGSRPNCCVPTPGPFLDTVGASGTFFMNTFIAAVANNMVSPLHTNGFHSESAFLSPAELA